jgi:hypothetical protein
VDQELLRAIVEPATIAALAAAALPTLRRVARTEIGLVFIVLTTVDAVAISRAVSSGFWLTRLALAAAIGIGVLSALQRRDAGETRLVLTAPAVLVLASLAWLVAVEASGTGTTELVFGLLATAVAVVVVSLVASNGRALRSDEVAALLALTAVVGCLAGYVADDRWRVCRQDKCTVLGELYRGGFVSENVLGLTLMWMIAFAISAAPGRRRTVIIAAGAVLLLATGSRTAVFGLSAGVVVAAIGALLATRRDGRYVLPSWLAVAIPTACAVGSLWLIGTATTADFSNRGRRWRAIADFIGVDSLSGGGASSWETIQTALGQATFPHSTFGLFLVYGGLVAVALYVAVLASMLAAVGASTRRALGPVLVPVSTLPAVSVIELLWNPTAVDFTALVVLLLLAWSALWSARRRPDGEVRRVPGGRHPSESPGWERSETYTGGDERTSGHRRGVADRADS